MNKKITILILLTLIFTAFSYVKAEEQKPDLLISDIRLTSGDSILSIFVVNNSSSNYTGDLEYKVEGLDSYSNGIRSVFLSLSPAAEKEVFVRDLPYEPLLVGKYIIKITIDPNNKISEASEENNKLEKTISVDPTKYAQLFKVTDIKAGSIIKNGASIFFNTVSNASCKVLYGNSESLTQSEIPGGDKSYWAQLSSLNPATKYYYKVKCEAPYWDSDEMHTFVTANNEDDVTISDINAETISPTSVKISWKTPRDGACYNGISYGTVKNPLLMKKEKEDKYGECGYEHEFILENLENNKTYYYEIYSYISKGVNIGTTKNNLQFLTSIVLPDLIIKDITFGKDVESGRENCLIAKIFNIGEGVAKTNPGSGVVVSWSAPDNNISLFGVSQAIGLSKEEYVLIARCLNSDELKSLGNKALILASVNKNGSDQDPVIEESNFQNNELKKEIIFITPDTQLTDINNSAKSLNDGKISELLSEIKQLRNELREQAAELKYLKIFATEMKALNSNMQSAIKAFITYGVDENTKKLGEGERAAVINSYEAAFDKLPQTEAELNDTIKIANGRFPSVTSNKAEKLAKEQFIKIYKRVPDLNDAKDNAAIKVMAYGLRQKAENRNLNSEKAGIKIFKAIYGYNPKTTEDWNTMQAITYSGAARKKDSDGDLLSDEMEAQYGTDPKNPDTDGDGFKDGTEINGGFDPLKK